MSLLIAFIVVCGLAFLGITAKFLILLYRINSKKKAQRIITPSERIQLRKWVIIFSGATVAIFTGFATVLLTSF